MARSLSDTDYRRLFEAMPGLYIVLTPDFSIVTASEDYVKVSGIGLEEMCGRDFFAVFFSDSSDPNESFASNLRESLQHVLATRTPHKIEAHSYNSSKVNYWSSISIPVMDPNGEVVFIVRRVEDVTAAVRKEEERELFFQYSFDLQAIVGADGYFKRLNPAFERVLGHSTEELCSRPLVEFMHPEDVAKTKKGIRTLTEGTATIASVNRYRCKDSSYKWFSWNTIPKGNLFYSVGRDITGQIEAEERINALNRELERKNVDLEAQIEERMRELTHSEAQVQQLQKMDAIGRLAGGIAHDFNNMLGAIALYCDLLADSNGRADLVQRAVQDIRLVGTRAAALTRQLLIFSRKQIVQAETIELNPLIQHMEKMLTRLIGENIKIKMKLAPRLHPIAIDPSQMEQVILNLVVNAKDALPKGGTITLETSNVYLDEKFTSKHLSVEKGHYVLITASDDGTGMPPEIIDKIFEPFFTTKPPGKGTGLGLSTTYGIIKQGRGTIWVYSELGRGTTFKIYLPVVESAAITSAPAPVKPVVFNGTQTVLLVEDDSHLRSAFVPMLEGKGYKVLVASDGKEAVDLCRKYSGDIHLLLTDVIMPGISGFDLAKEVLKLRPDLRVLYMSGYTSDALENSGVESTTDLDFIQKPFDTNTLLRKIHEVLFKPN
ncbi:MAG: PAS domain S-box protein [Bdellovibrionales bacterium]|nr:PAS domain S-box protein [Bdellovibrionales bacterium]